MWSETAVGGRRITLDAVLEPHDVVLKARRVESSLSAGFRMDWLSGSADGVEVNLSCGAGCGSPYMVLSVSKDGDTVGEEIVDMRDVVQTWAASILAEPTGTRQSSYRPGDRVETSWVRDGGETEWLPGVVLDQEGEAPQFWVRLADGAEEILPLWRIRLAVDGG